ncbi:MAG: hypothetical protein QM690_13265 [Sphingobium sp.]
MNQHPDWTEAEDVLLRRLTREGRTANQIADVMGRTHYGVRARRKRLGLAYDPAGRAAVGAPLGPDNQQDWESDAARGSARLALAIVRMLERREERQMVAA